MNDLSDEGLAHLVQNGQTEVFGELVKRYEDKMLRYAQRFFQSAEDAKDRVQEVFIKAYVNINSFNTAMRFSPWLYRVAHNAFINFLKKRKRDPLLFFDFDIFIPHAPSTANPATELHENEVKQTLQDHLASLDYKYREPLILYYYEEMDYKTIADILKLPISTVGVRLQRARKLLKEKIALDLHPSIYDSIIARIHS